VLRPAKPVRYAILGASLIYAGVLHLAGLQVDSLFKLLLAFLPALGAAVLTAWDLLLWRLPGLHRLTRRPRLQGLWKAELQPTADSHIPPDGNRGPIPAYLVITQTYWSVAVRQYTGEGKSDSRAFFWERHPGGGVETLSFLYENVPEQRHQHRNQRHLGSCSLDLTSRTPQEITGDYFTDRYTKGDMLLTLVDRTTGHSSFRAADAHEPKLTRRQNAQERP
jgi:SMODS-associating 2TM, beta-strand rich effector domain